MEVRNVVSKDGKKNFELTVFKYGEKIPENLQYGRYQKGEVTFAKIIKKTKEQKEASKKIRLQACKTKWDEQKKVNKAVTEEIDKEMKSISQLKKDIKKLAITQDVSAKREQLGIKLARIEELKAKKKNIPKQFK